MNLFLQIITCIKNKDFRRFVFLILISPLMTLLQSLLSWRYRSKVLLDYDFKEESE
jgi:hypothetical protein